MKGFRTIIANAIVALPPLLEAMSAVIPQLQGMRIIQGDWWQWYCLIVLTMNVYLRTITTTPVGKSQENI